MVLQSLIDLNQRLLNTIGVGHPALDDVCDIAAQHGVHAKLTGAGGGGCAFVLLPQHMSERALTTLSSAFKYKGFEVWETTVGGQGVASHETLPFDDAEGKHRLRRTNSFMPPVSPSTNVI